MKIRDLRVHSIAIADPPLRSSYGLHAPYALRNIVELESEDGIVGIAETYGGEGPADALRKITPDVVGKDAYRLTGDLLDAAEGEGTGSERSHVMSTPGENPLDVGPRTYSAIETASLDLIGRSVGVPVCDLLGGRVRDAVPFSAYAFYKHGGGGGEGTDAREDKYGECLTSRIDRAAGALDGRRVRIQRRQAQGRRAGSRTGDRDSSAVAAGVRL